MSNFCAGVATGVSGSNRFPRVLAAVSRGSQGNFNTLSPTRYTNDRPNPLFIERFNLLPVTAASVFTDDSVQVNIHFRGKAITAQPVTAGVLFESVVATSMPVLTWKLDKPLVVFQGESFEIQVNSEANLIVAALGFYESSPAPQRYRYIPYVLSDRIFVDDSASAAAREEALRNDGERPFYVTRVMYRPPAATNEVLIDGSGTEWMREQLHSSVQFINFRHNRLFETILREDESLTALVANSTGARRAFDVSFVGYRTETLPLRVAPKPGSSMPLSDLSQFKALGPGLQIRRNNS